RLDRAQLVVEHRRALLLVAEGTQLRPRIVELPASSFGDGACRAEVVLRAQQLNVGRIELGLQVAVLNQWRPLGSHDRLAELTSRALELGAKAPSLLLQDRDASLVGLYGRAQRVAQLLPQACALALQRLELLLEHPHLPLGPQRPPFEGGVDRLAGPPSQLAEALQLLERLAVLILEQRQAVLRRRCTLLGATTRLPLFAQARLWPAGAGGRLRCGDRPRLLRDALRPRRDHRQEPGDPEDGETEHDEHAEQEQGVRVPRRVGARDRRVGAGQLDGGGAADARAEREGEQDGDRALVGADLRRALQRLQDATR